MKKTPFVLTEENYFSPERPHVSVSQIKDYLRCPAFYKRRHVDRDPAVQVVPTDAMKRGSLVDDLLTRGKTAMRPRVLKKDDPDEYAAQQSIPDRLLIGQRYWDEAMEIAAAVKASPLWKSTFDSAETRYQVLLSSTAPEIALPVCGLADRIDVSKESECMAEIIDLKVVSPAKIGSPAKWMWNVREMRYAHQFALYQVLLSGEHGIDPNKVSCRHVVAAFVEPGFVEVRSYVVPQEMLDEAMEEIVIALKGIAAGDFRKKEHAVEKLPYVGFNRGFGAGEEDGSE